MAAKLVVHVLDASDLMPKKDTHGSASPFVQIKFQNQKHRTSTKNRDLNPSWNEKIVFNITKPEDLAGETIDVYVYNDNASSSNAQRNNFLGRVRISGMSVPDSEQEANVQRYPLDKKGIFSNVKGDIALKIYVAGDGDDGGDGFKSFEEQVEELLQRVENDPPPPSTHRNDEQERVSSNPESNGDKKKKKKEEAKQSSRTFYSVPVQPPSEKQDWHENRADFSRSGAAPPATVMQMQFPMQRPEYGVVETRPPLAARTGYWGRDKTASTYDLVEHMNFLYVRVVKARDLPAMDISGSIDPYVEVKVGNYRGVTHHLEKNQNPVWNRVFAFSKEKLQSNVIEIAVKDKDIGKDEFVGKLLFDVSEVPRRVPPDSPLAPQWYRLGGNKTMNQSEIMLAVWMGTQADEAFPESWHSDAHSMSEPSLTNTRSKVYFSPKLYYLRAHIVAAHDLVISDGRMPDTFVRVQLGHQVRVTRPSPMKSNNPEWNEELMFVASEPFDEYIIISVEDRVAPGKDELIGRIIIPVRDVPQRIDTTKLPDARWFALQKPSSAAEEEGEKKREMKFSSRILLRLCTDSGYHVLDESTHFSSDLQPSSKHLRKPGIGLLEVGILSARNLLPMKGREGKLTDAYCVAKYGNKWVRTRTLLDTLHPRWNEQYTWEVYDPCTVITIGVFDNCHIQGKDETDKRIGKVRIRLSTLETDRVYTHSYPLLVLTPSGLRHHGELHLAIRFTCTAWANMVVQYGKPLLPKMHYIQPLSVRHIDWLRHQAMQIVAVKLSRAEPPLRREIVEYMLDVDYHMFSLRRSKANFYRIMSLLSIVSYACRWFDGICYWKNPLTTILVHVLFLILICYPELILPTIFLYLFVIGMWNYRLRPRLPPHMDARVSQAENAYPDELDEEFDTFPSSRPTEVVRMRYDKLRSMAGRVQSVIGDMATQGERLGCILRWRDPRATTIFIMLSLIVTVFLYVTPFQVTALMLGIYTLRHPRFRSRMPSVPVNFFKRLPARSDSLL